MEVEVVVVVVGKYKNCVGGRGWFSGEEKTIKMQWWWWGGGVVVVMERRQNKRGGGRGC